jgi:hypothetical protein
MSIKPNLTLFVVLNFIIASIVFILGLNSSFPDQADYLALADGILHGEFSSYVYLEDYYPATLRSPAYPLFLAFGLALFKSILPIKLLQLALYFCTIFLSLRIIQKLTTAKTPQYIFLVLSSVCIQLPYYAAQISSELLTIFLVILVLYLLFNGNIKSVFSNFLTGISFSMLIMTKPAFLLLPFLLCLLVLIISRQYLKNYIFICIFFMIGTMPFAVWNQANHGVFKPTTIEGMATIAHMGYWNFKLPVGYQSDFDDYHAYVVSDFTNPFFYSDEATLNNISIYESQWRDITNQLEPLLTESFKRDLEYMRVDPLVFVTYPSEYVLKREELLTQAIIQSVKDDPLYYLKTRAYNFFRVFFTGINKSNFSNDSGYFSKIQMVLAFAISFIIIFCGFIYASIFLFKNWKTISYELAIIYFFILYTAGVHTPFSVQARYSVPIHLCLLILLSIITSRRYLDNKT